MARLPDLWIPLVAFVLGLIGGVILDRSIGGPGGLTLGLLVLIVPGTLAFSGPLAMQYWGNRSARETSNRELFRAHRDLLLNRVFWAAGGAALTYDIDNYRWSSLGEYTVRVPADSGMPLPLGGIIQWPNARDHLLADPNVSPALSDVEKRAVTGRQQKKDLDDAFAAAIGSALKAEFGYDFASATPETGWSEHPPPAIWYPEPVVRMIRQRQTPDSITVQGNTINHVTGEPPTQVQKLLKNGMQALQVVGTQMLDPDRFVRAYERVRSNDQLRTAVDQARATAKADAAVVTGFAELARSYAERVEASEKHMLGTCLGCASLTPR